MTQNTKTQQSIFTPSVTCQTKSVSKASIKHNTYGKALNLKLKGYHNILQPTLSHYQGFSLRCCEILTLQIKVFLKCYYDENHIFSVEAILIHKQVACMRRKLLFTIFKYLLSFQRYSSFFKYAN